MGTLSASDLGSVVAWCRTDVGSFAIRSFGFSVSIMVSASSGSLVEWPRPEGPSLCKVG